MEEDILVADVEFKFAQDGATGEFNGYASVFNHQDAHGDVVKPGAFAESLAERKAAGRSLPMHVMHGIFGGDGVPVGVWKHVAEDDKGLAVEGKISGMNTEAGRLLYERVKDGALGGLSIGYSIKPGGSKVGKGAGEPKRTITAVKLHEISLVDDPSNAMSRVQEVKASRRRSADEDKSVSGIIAAYRECRSMPDGSERDAIMTQLQDVFEGLTGRRITDEVKSTPTTIREFEAALREIGFSRSQAADLAARGFKSEAPRDGAAEQAALRAAAVAEFGDFSGFSLPKF